MSREFIHIGCGLCAPEDWKNYDASPTMRLQNIPIIGPIIKPAMKVKFPSNVRYGNIVKGIGEITPSSVRAVYCSHVLEHLALEELRKALGNVYKMLKPGGLFRMVLPDLLVSAKDYVLAFENGKSNASIDFMKETLLGEETRKRGLIFFLKSMIGNSNHLWMWDRRSLADELLKAGFTSVRDCSFGDGSIPEFRSVEEKGRFQRAFALEAAK